VRHISGRYFPSRHLKPRFANRETSLSPWYAAGIALFIERLRQFLD